MNLGNLPAEAPQVSRRHPGQAFDRTREVALVCKTGVECGCGSRRTEVKIVAERQLGTAPEPELAEAFAVPTAETPAQVNAMYSDTGRKLVESDIR